MAQIATVAAITGTGKAFAINEQGVSRELKAGDVLQKGETIRTVGDVLVELLMEDGRLLAVAPNQVLRLDENVSESDQRPTAQDSAIGAPAATADTILQALERGTDLSTELEATAATVGGGTGADGGSTFVTLLRIVEGVDPLTFNFSFTPPDATSDLETNPEALTTTTMVLTADPEVFEGSPGVTYTVVLGDPTTTDMTVTLSNGAVIVVPAGSTTGSVLVPVQGDDVYKDGETLQTTVDTVQGGDFTTITVSDANVVTVVNDTIDITPVSVGVSVLDGDANNVIEGNQLTFRFSVNQAPETDLILNVTIGGVDQTVTIAAGSLFTDVTVDSRADENYLQGSSTVTGTVNSVSPAADGNFENLSIVGASATATIVDDGDITTVGISGVASVEEGSIASYTLNLSAPGETDVVVNLAYSGVAADGTDFSGTASVTIPAGASTVSFDIPTITDTSFEGDEVFNVEIVNATGGNFESVLVDEAARSVDTTIADNDQPTVSIAAAPASMEEDAEGVMTYTVTLSNPSAFDTTVTYTLSGTASTGDYSTTATGTMVIPAGELTGTFTVDPAADSTFENAETVVATLASATSNDTPLSVSATPAVGTIVDNDAPSVSIAVAPASIQEDAAGVMTYTVSLSNPSAFDTTVTYSLSGTASTGDYSTTATGSMVILAGQTTGTFTVDPAADSTFENAETVVATLASATSNDTPLSVSATPAVGTIVDNDAPTVSVAVAPATVAEDGTPNLVYTFTLSNPSAFATTVNYTLSGTAANGTDYTGSALTGSVTIPAGSTSATVTIDPSTDSTFEGDETVIATITSASSNNVALASTGGPANGTIVDNDQPTVSVAVNPGSVLEDGTPNLVYTFTLSNPSAFATTVNYTLSGTAANGTDYTGSALTGSVTIPAGSTTATVTIDPSTDSTFEGNETVVASITSASSNSVALAATGGPANGTIVDNDQPTVSVAVNPGSVLEDGTPNLVYTFTLSNPSAFATTVNYTLSGTAANGTDYTGSAVTGTVTIPAGSTTATVTIDPSTDSTFEGNETVIATITSANSNSVALASTGGPATGTIVDNDQPTVSVAVNPGSVAEDGTPNLVYTFTLSNPSAFATTVNYSLSGTAANGTDYTGSALTGTVTIPAGSTTATVTIDPTTDTTFEGNETVVASITSASSNSVALTSTGGPATGTIVDDDGAPSFAINDVTVNEADGTITFTVTKTGLTTQASSVDFSVAPNSAVTPGDYTAGTSALSGTLNFAANVATQTITLNVINDAVYELTENFNVNLANAVNATISDNQGVGTITDNDALPAFSINDVTVSESAGTITFTVTKTGLTDQASSVHYDVAPDSAVTPGDYAAGTSALSGDLSFAAGVTTQTITLNVTSDQVQELTENFNVNLSAAVGATISDDQGVGTITDDDGAPSFAINDVTVNEAAGTITFTVTKTGETTQASSVNFSVAPNTAGTPGDYSGTLTGTLNFAANVAEQTITLNVTNDAVYELTENFNVNLLNPVNATISDNQGVGTIIDNDTTVVTAVTSDTKVEGTDLVHTVTLSNPADHVTSFAYVIGDGDSNAIGGGTDYSTPPTFSNDVTLVGGNLIVPAGVTSFTITTKTTNDTLDENIEHYNLSVGAVAAKGNITDNDVTIVTLGDVTVNEGVQGATISASIGVNPVTGSPLVITLSNGATITIPVGQTNGTSTSFEIQGDDVYNDGESYTLSIVGTSGSDFDSLATTDTALVTVNDTVDTTTVTLSAATPVTEGGSIIYTATVNNAVTGTPLVVTLTGSTTITIPVGETTANSAAVSVRADEAYVQGNQNVTVGITGTSGGNFEALNTSSTVTTVVQDDSDATTVSVARVGTGDVIEGNDVTFRFSVDHAPEGNLTLTTSLGEVTILSGQTYVDKTVPAPGVPSGGGSLTVSVSSFTGGNYENLDKTDTAIVPIIDSTPTAVDDLAEISEAGTRTVGNDVVMIIDRSGSMGPAGTTGGSDPDGSGPYTSRLEIVKEAIANLFASGSVHSVFIVSFGSNATVHSSGVNGGWYTNLTDALAAVNAISIDSRNIYTDYDAALAEVRSALGTGGNFVTPPAGGDRLVSMFLSDGEPTDDNGTGTDGIKESDTNNSGYGGLGEESYWINYLQSNGFNASYAVGFGGIDASNSANLEPIAWRSPETAATHTTGAADSNVLVAGSNVDALTNALLSTIAETGLTLAGNIVLDNDLSGSDAPISLVSVTYGTATHVFATQGNVVTFNLADSSNQAVGTVKIFANGNYQFDIAEGVDISDSRYASLSYTIADTDGSTSTANFRLGVTDRSEVNAYDNFNQAVVTSSVVTYDDTPLYTNGSTSNWTSTGDLALNDQGEYLRIRDDNGSGGAGGTGSSPNLVISTTGGSLKFDAWIDGGTDGAGDVASWKLQVSQSGSWADVTSSNSGVSGGTYGGNIANTSSATTSTGALSAGTYRLVYTVRDNSNNSEDFRIYVDNIVARTPSGGISTTNAIGNVLTDANNYLASNDAWGAVDDKGAEGATLKVWNGSAFAVATETGVTIAGTYGDLLIRSDGSYTYTPDADLANVGKQDAFSYQLAQADGDVDTAKLVIQIGSTAYTAPTVYTGTDANNNSTGTANSDVMLGNAGNDTLAGAGGDDRLEGGAGNDFLTGGAGADVFKWSFGEQGTSGTPAVDHITDFSKADDKLNLADLLQGENSGNLSHFLSFATEGGHAVLNVSTQADGDVVQKVVFDNYADVAALQAAFAALQAAFADVSGADLIAKMKTNGNLITD